MPRRCVARVVAGAPAVCSGNEQKIKPLKVAEIVFEDRVGRHAAAIGVAAEKQRQVARKRAGLRDGSGNRRGGNGTRTDRPFARLHERKVESQHRDAPTRQLSRNRRETRLTHVGAGAVAEDQQRIRVRRFEQQPRHLRRRRAGNSKSAFLRRQRSHRDGVSSPDVRVLPNTVCAIPASILFPTGCAATRR